MSANSTIEWTDSTWNPVRGCTKISPGCKHCYAETFAERFRGVPGHSYEQGFDLRLVPGKLAEPLRWGTPKTIFVNSMSDLFQEDVPDWYVEQVARVMQLANWHTYQVLTKRSGRLREMLSGKLSFVVEAKHIWWGTSVEDKKYGVPRISDLRQAPAAVRFLSVEPLLEDLGEVNLAGIHWVIVGGESGAGARPMDKAWVKNIRRQCDATNVPFFFKQWGGVRKSEAGRELDGRTFDDMPSRTAHPVPGRAKRSEMITDVATWAWFARSEVAGVDWTGSIGKSSLSLAANLSGFGGDCVAYGVWLSDQRREERLQSGAARPGSDAAGATPLRSPTYGGRADRS